MRAYRWQASSEAASPAVRIPFYRRLTLFFLRIRTTAGGFDAVWLLVCEPPEDTPGIPPLPRIERLWTGTPGVAPLLAQESKAQGVALESLDAVPGLASAVAAATRRD